MPRIARVLNDKHIYHIMLRGNNKEAVFKNDEDKKEILKIMTAKKQQGKYYLYAYCVMDNHIHLIFKEGSDSISRSIKRIGLCYAQYFNKKYQRIGHVFQDRYRSENITTDSYLLSAIRYVHRNPMKAGIGNMDKYKWSSFKGYFDRSETLVETDEIISMFAQDKEKGLKAFIDFNHEEKRENFIDIDEEMEFNERNVQEYINEYLIQKGIAFENLKEHINKGTAEELIKHLLRKSDISKRGIAKILGLGREMVRKVSLSTEPSP